MRRLLVVLLLAGTVLATTAAANGRPGFKRVAVVRLLPENGSAATGSVTFYDARADATVVFDLSARGIPQNDKIAYGVWLVGGKRDHFLGFAPYQAKGGKVQATGPRLDDQKHIRRWLRRSANMLLTVEADQKPTAPGTAILRGNVTDVGL